MQHLFEQPYNRSEWISFLSNIFPNREFFQNPEPLPINNRNAESAFFLGSITLQSNGIERTISVFEVILQDNIILERSRVGLRNLLKQYWKERDAAFIVYRNSNPDTWRFTFVSETRELDENRNLVVSKTEPKRYTYLLGEGESVRTAKGNFEKLKNKVDTISLLDIKEAFSVEKMSKEFFKEYKDLYEQLVLHFTGKKIKKVDGKFQEVQEKPPHPDLQVIFRGNEKSARDFCKKLLGRIVFLYFIQKKGWLGAPIDGDLNDGNKDFLKHLFQNCSDKKLFYPQILHPLFFDILNTKRKNDIVSLEGFEQCKIPYLNGGLFEKEDVDELTLLLPEEILAKLFEVFDKYNFTIYEDDPNDHTVAVDPEMLGNIFENLLEDNKDKGAFYTPKAIVQYMCQESLIQYLVTYFEDRNISVTDINMEFGVNQVQLFSPNEARKGQQLLTEHTTRRSIKRVHIEHLLKRIMDDNDFELIEEFKSEFKAALENVKVCDPAIGSGAFPMGLLNEIYSTLQFLHYLEFQSLETFKPADVKKNIIQKSIYGVDIEKGAVDIARLRFWLSLIVDEESPSPLPNLDFKIIVGNSLAPMFNDTYIEIDWNLDETKYGFFGQEAVVKKKELLNTIAQKQKLYFVEKGDKKKLASEIRILKTQLLKPSAELQLEKLPTPKKSKKNDANSKADDTYQLAKSKLELSIIELGRCIKDPTIQYQFFDWKLDFPDILNPELNQNPGFDIIIGNPPYMRIQGIRNTNSELADIYLERFESATGAFDLYILFVEQAHQLIKQKGIINYIMPFKWVNSAFGVGLRRFILNQDSFSKLISFEEYQVFNASTYTGLHWFEKDANLLQYTQLDRNLPTPNDLFDYLNSLSDEAYQHYNVVSMGEDTWTLTDGIDIPILNKIERIELRAEDIFDRIFTGLQTSQDSVYFLHDCTLDGSIVEGYSKEIKRRIQIEIGLVKPILKGDQVHRYEKLQTNIYVIFPYKIIEGKAVLFTEPEIQSNFPFGYSYLKENEEKLRNREKGLLLKDEYWFKYIYPKNLTLMNQKKLFCRDICSQGEFSIDLEGSFYTTTTVYGYIVKNEITLSLQYLLALMNSKVVWYYLTKTGTVLANGFFRFMPRYVERIPIPQISEEEQRPFEELVEQILTKKERGENTDTEERRIDEMVYSLYHLTPDEINHIEGKE